MKYLRLAGFVIIGYGCYLLYNRIVNLFAKFETKQIIPEVILDWQRDSEAQDKWDAQTTTLAKRSNIGTYIDTYHKLRLVFASAVKAAQEPISIVYATVPGARITKGVINTYDTLALNLLTRDVIYEIALSDAVDEIMSEIERAKQTNITDILRLPGIKKVNYYFWNT